MKLKLAAPSDIWDLIKDASRVSVIDEGGKTRWKTPEEIVPEDRVILKSGSKPVTMSGDPGRPRKEEEEKDKKVNQPADEGAIGERIADKNRRRGKTVKQDHLLKVARKDPDSSEVMDLVLRELASEQAALKFEREEMEREGKEISEVSGRRMRVLVHIGDQWLRRQERLSDIGVVDLNSPAMKAFVSAFVETIGQVMDEIGFRGEERGALLNKLSGRIDEEWKVEVRRRMKRAAE